MLCFAGSFSHGRKLQCGIQRCLDSFLVKSRGTGTYSPKCSHQAQREVLPNAMLVSAWLTLGLALNALPFGLQRLSGIFAT